MVKTTYTLEAVEKFLKNKAGDKGKSVRNLVEGNISQAFSFKTEQNETLVLRIAPQANDFLCDRYAFEALGTRLPIPRVREIGNFDSTSYFCISDFVEGKPSNALGPAAINAIQPEILRTCGKVFTTDISATSGYGPVEITSGNGKFATWQESIQSELDYSKPFHLHASNINLDAALVDALVEQVRVNSPFASEQRYLLHKDFGFDNILIHEEKVVAVIDWACISYGDWMYDYAKSDFWWPGYQDDKHKFAAEYELDNQNLNQREALYWAVIALSAISFADKFQNQDVAKWLQDNVPSKII